MNHLSACLKHFFADYKECGCTFAMHLSGDLFYVFFLQMFAYVEKKSEYCVCELIIY